MSDDRLQELRRAWQASGAHDDEVALLRERMRIGELSAEQLGVASLCGHTAAATVSGVAPLVETDLLRWLEALHARHPTATLRAGVTLAEACYPQWDTYYADDPRPRAAVDAVKSLLAGEDLLYGALERHAAELEAALHGLFVTSDLGRFAAVCAQALVNLARGDTAHLYLNELAHSAKLSTHDGSGAPRLLAAVKAALTAWGTGV